MYYLCQNFLHSPKCKMKSQFVILYFIVRFLFHQATSKSWKFTLDNIVLWIFYSRLKKKEKKKVSSDTQKPWLQLPCPVLKNFASLYWMTTQDLWKTTLPTMISNVQVSTYLIDWVHVPKRVWIIREMAS